MVRATFVIIALQAAAAQPFGFQDYALGTTTEQFMSRVMSAGEYGPRRPACSDRGMHPNWLAPLPRYARAGEVRCSFEQLVGSSWVREGLALGEDYEVTADFDFYEDHLYRIELFSDATAATSIRDGLIARFGRPSGAASAAVQNAYGAQFPQTFTTWTTGRYSVSMIVPALNTERMAVIYTDLAAEARIEAIVQRDNAAPM